MASSDATITVESSPTKILESLTPAERKTWLEKNEFPESKLPKSSETPTGESSTPAKTEVAESAPEKAADETSAESAPATTEPRGKVKNAETRIPELLSDRKKAEEDAKALRKELKARDAENAELKRQLAEKSAPVAQPKEEVAKPQRYDKDEKGNFKYETDEAFHDAEVNWKVDRRIAERDRQTAEAREKAKQEAINKKYADNWAKTRTEVLAENPDFEELVEKAKDFNDLLAKDGVLIGSLHRHGAALAYYFAKNRSEMLRLMAIEDVFERYEAVYEIAKSLPKKLAAEIKAAEDSKKPPESSPAPAKKAPPEPATSISGKTTVPTDDENAAAADGDFKRFQRAANEADWRKKGAKS